MGFSGNEAASFKLKKLCPRVDLCQHARSTGKVQIPYMIPARIFTDVLR